MDSTVTIGEFSRLSHLGAKALRHYHDVGLLVPERIDPSGYRRYGLAQVQQAQLIGRLRRLDMPVPDIKAVLAAPGEQERDRAIIEHLQRMQDALDRTTQVVASLRALLRPQTRPLTVEYRTVAPIPVLGIRERVRHQDVAGWCAATFPALHEALGRSGIEPAGPGGATYDTDFFEQDEGDVLAYVPVVAGHRATVGATPLTLPAGRFAVALHQGPYDEIDRAYGDLGSHVASHDTALADPIREQYLIGPDRADDSLQYRTEIWWPIATSADAREQHLT